jgi:hypothetical protein
MKKTLVIIALVLILSTSVIAGTLAMYTTTIDDFASGSVVAKEFVLLEGGTDTFTTDVKIAPSETVEWDFSVQNYNGAIVSETAMGLDFEIDVAAVTGKSMIDPLVVTVSDELGNPVCDELGNPVGPLTGSGTITFNDEFLLNAVGQEKTYTVTVSWPETSAGIDDIDFAGSNYAAAVTVSVTGTQPTT